jgi:hypothetical protein
MARTIAEKGLGLDGQRYCALMAEVVQKYDVYVAYHLQSVLEARGNPS